MPLFLLAAPGRRGGPPTLLDKLAEAAEAGPGTGETNENRRLLLRFVIEHPGLNIQELADALNIQRNAARYHIRRMVRDATVVATKQGHEVLHFPPMLPPTQRLVLGLLRIESVRKVALALQDTPQATWEELAERLGTTTRTIRRAVRALKHQDLIRLEKVGRGRSARLHPDLRLVLARWQPNGLFRPLPPEDAAARTRDGNNPLM